MQLNYFRRIFPNLPAWSTAGDVDHIFNQIAQMMYLDLPDAADMPAGFTYLGQFIFHDISFDSSPLDSTVTETRQIRNYRSPAFNLDGLYGGGPNAAPYLYRWIKHDWQRFQFQVGRAQVGPTNHKIDIFDLPRVLNGVDEGSTAVIPDLRNDEHLILSQLHLAFLFFHNYWLEALKNKTSNDTTLFKEAQKMVRWHYQWIILNEYLPQIVDEETLAQVKQQGPNYYHVQEQAYIPVECAAAVMRFGHSQVREHYRFNSSTTNLPLLSPHNAPFTVVDWRRFFPLKADYAHPSVNRATLIGPHLSAGIEKLPKTVFPAHSHSHNENNLAFRNLKRGYLLGLPSGQDLARALGLKPIQIQEDQPLFPDELRNNTPLWYYILYEAEREQGGKKLGPLGGLLLSEVMIGILKTDKTSVLHQPAWKPKLSDMGKFSMATWLQSAGIYHGALLTNSI